MSSPRVSPRYVAAIKTGLLVQCLALLAVAMLESLRATLFVVVAILAHWVAMVLFAIRRPEHPSRWDLLACRIGLIPLLTLAWGLGPIIWYVEGDFSLFERSFGKPLVSQEDIVIPLYVAAGIWLVLGPVLDIIRNEREIRRQRKAATQATTAPPEKARAVVRNGAQPTGSEPKQGRKVR